MVVAFGIWVLSSLSTLRIAYHTLPSRLILSSVNGRSFLSVLGLLVSVAFFDSSYCFFAFTMDCANQPGTSSILSFNRIGSPSLLLPNDRWMAHWPSSV